MCETLHLLNTYAKSQHAEVYIHTLTYIKLSKSRQRRQSLFKRVFTVLLEKSENMNTKEKKVKKLCLSEDTAEKIFFFLPQNGF